MLAAFCGERRARSHALRIAGKQEGEGVPKWYVVQVHAGRDDVMAQAIVRKVAEMAERKEGFGSASEVLERLFSPRYETQWKVRGEWKSVYRRLTPGYLVAVSHKPEKLQEALREVSGFARLVRNENGFIPLAPDEVSWISRLTDGGRCAAPMSTAVKEGDEIVVLDGVLFGNTFPVKRIDRHRSMAWVEVTFLGRTKEIPLGLKIIAKKRADN